ncbi:hypothetical protein DV736_g2860, partial [Chaetothyriales sp. CBS 134916]
MEDTTQEAVKILAQSEKDLATVVSQKELFYDQLENHIAKFRIACSNLFIIDLQTAVSQNADTRLWSAHGRVNSKFRSHLATLREQSAKKKYVERRKAEAIYEAFLKSSIRFYRAFIQRLAARFKDVPDIFNIAKGFGPVQLTADTPLDLANEQKLLLLRSCFATLIHLGDLSRYRETELPKKGRQRNWGPAIGYYDLAHRLIPADGLAFNQQAVISLAENDHFAAVYNLYQALTSEIRPGPARGNLELEFKKIRTRHARNESLFAIDSTSVDQELERDFLTYHARCYGDAEFPNHEDQCHKIVTALVQALKTRPYDSTAKKMCFINMAASHSAKQYASDEADSNPDLAMRWLLTSYKNLQDLNIHTFTLLLQLLVEELNPAISEQVGEMDEVSCIAHVTPLCRKILPHVRLYSLWLLSTAEFVHESKESIKHPGLDRLFDRYANALNILIKIFPLQKLPDCEHLLDEDHLILSSVAFSPEAKSRHTQGAGGNTKGRRSKGTDAKRPEVEMLMRIKDLVKDGLFLIKRKDSSGGKIIPLVFADMQFVRITSPSPPVGDGVESSIDSAIVYDSTVLSPNGSLQTTHPIARSPIGDLETMDGQPVGPMSTLSASNYPSSQFTAADLTRQFHQSLPAPPLPSPALAPYTKTLSLSSQSPFHPRPGGSIGSLSRPGTSRGTRPATPTGSGQTPLSGAIAFEQEIAQMHNNQNSSFPLDGFNAAVTPTSFYATSSSRDGFFRVNEPRQSQSPSWSSPANQTSGSSTEVPREAPRVSPFGAIGDSRPKSAKIPTRAQHG